MNGTLEPYKKIADGVDYVDEKKQSMIWNEMRIQFSYFHMYIPSILTFGRLLYDYVNAGFPILHQRQPVSLKTI